MRNWQLEVSEKTHKRLKMVALRLDMRMYEITEQALDKHLSELEAAFAEEDTQIKQQEEERQAADIKRREEVLKKHGMDRFKGWKPPNQPSN